MSYDMFIVQDPILNLGLLDNFKHTLIHWGGDTVPVKEPRGLLGQT